MKGERETIVSKEKRRNHVSSNWIIKCDDKKFKLSMFKLLANNIRCPF